MMDLRSGGFAVGADAGRWRGVEVRGNYLLGDYWTGFR